MSVVLWAAVLSQVALVAGFRAPTSADAGPSVPLFNAARSGMVMPVIGLGTGGYGQPNGQGGEYWNDTTAEAAVTAFLAAGGRRIDTSLLYFTQQGVGRAWTASGIAREDIFITSKCDSPAYGMVPAGYEETINSTMITLQQLQTSYVDLMLIHWPGTAAAPHTPPPCWTPPNNWTVCRAQTWQALVDLFRSGTLHAIGVSNYEPNHLQELIAAGGELPAVDQFEFHPYWHLDDAVTFCQQHRIQVNGYSPLGAYDHMAFNPQRMPVLLPNHPVPNKIAESHPGKTASQVILRWEFQQGLVLNPRSENATHMRETLDIFDFQLSESEMLQLANIDTPPENVCGDPRAIP